jgi:hypothetical protein
MHSNMQQGVGLGQHVGAFKPGELARRVALRPRVPGRVEPA